MPPFVGGEPRMVWLLRPALLPGVTIDAGDVLA
jgi:hypothetical protein